LHTKVQESKPSKSEGKASAEGIVFTQMKQEQTQSLDEKTVLQE